MSSRRQRSILLAGSCVASAAVLGLVGFLLGSADSEQDAWLGLGIGVVAGLILGLATSAATRFADRARRAELGVPDHVGTRPSYRMRVARPVDEVVQQARHVLAQLTLGPPTEDPVAGTLRATTSPSWWSWGDVVTVTIRPDGAGASLVEVASRPRLRMTVVDYGSNAGHVRLVSQALVPPA